MSDDSRSPATPQTIELREEVLSVETQRSVYAQATVRRERRLRQETVQLELVTEVLVITAQSGGPAVLLDGVPLAPGETREIILYQETARPGREIVVTQDVQLVKRRDIEVTTVQVELAYEELVVEQPPVPDLPPDRNLG